MKDTAKTKAELIRQVRALRRRATKLDKLAAQYQQAQMALRESDLLRAKILSSLNEAVFVVNPITRAIIDWNTTAEEMFGYSRAEMLGRDTQMLHVNPDLFERFGREALQAYATVGYFATEFYMRRNNGQIFPTEHFVRPVYDRHGNIEIVVSVVRDITERRRAEAALRESEERLDLTIRSTGVGLWDWMVPTGQVVYNERWAEIIGYTLAELAPVSIDTWFRYVHPDDLVRSNQALTKHFAGETEYYECEARMRHKRGEWVWVLDRGKVVEWDAAHKPVRMTGTHLDISERKHAEEALQAQRDEAQRYLDVAGVMIVALDEQARVRLINRKGCALLGYSEDQILGRNWFELCVPARLHQRMSEIEEQVRRRCFEFLDYYEYPVITQSGKERLLGIRSTVLHEATGHRTGVLFSAEDVTERWQISEELRRRSEDLIILNDIGITLSQPLPSAELVTLALEHLRETLHIKAGAVWVKKENSAWQLLGHAGLSPEMARALDPLNRRAGMIAQAFRAGDLVIAENYTTADWGERLFEREDLYPCVAVPLKPGANTQGVMLLFGLVPRTQSSQGQHLLRGVGYHLAMALENRYLAEKTAEIEILRELDRLRSELIANVSHELRTPLGLIKTCCSALLSETMHLTPGIQQEFLHDIDGQTDHLAKLVDNLLDLSRMQSGRLRLDRHALDLAALAARVIADLGGHLEQFRFVCDFAPTPFIVAVDATRIEQVIVNLISNAIKYSPRGGTIKIQGRMNEDQVIVSVNDQGIGIPPDDLERVFERFYRADNSARLNVSGVGLGLAVCRGVVEAHGGKIWAESVLDQGSTFLFTLPLQEPRVLATGAD